MNKIRIEDFRIGFKYEELQMDSSRYLNKGLIWVKKTYNYNSPRLHKINKLIEEGKVRKSKLECQDCKRPGIYLQPFKIKLLLFGSKTINICMSCTLKRLL